MYSNKYKNYRKKNLQPMRPYIPGEDLIGVSVSPEDTPEEGGMIAVNPENTEDKWYVTKKFFDENYEAAEGEHAGKTLHNSDLSGAHKNVSDLTVVGNGDMFQLLCKASSQKEGWMKSTKALDTEHGVLVQVTTQQRNPDGSYAVAEALAFVPDVRIKKSVLHTGGRYLGL